jgi:DNA mismatch repair protein MLH3
MEKLPEDTRTKLRSTQIITSLPSLLSELFQNSLDAGASTIDIGVDCDAWTCWVKDDGTGMSKENLHVLAVSFEQGRYGTSKAHDLDSLKHVTTLGFRGEALASISDLCCLEISTRASVSRESWSIILKGGKCLYNGPSVRWRRETPGTVLYIRDAFFNLPIRRLSHPSPTKTYELLRQEIDTYALAFPSVAFSLTMENNESTSVAKEKTYRIPRTSSVLTTFRRLFSRALAEDVEEIHQQQDDIKIDGFVSLNGAHSKAHQYLYINRHPLVVGDLHKLIDNKFACSSFAKHALDEVADREYTSSRRSPRKSIKRHVYVLNITLPPSRIDNCLDPAKAIVHIQGKDNVSSFLGSVIENVLLKHGFLHRRRSKARAHSEEPGASPPRKRQKTTRRLRRESSEPSSTIHLPLFPEDPENSVMWTDPRTGQRFQVDQRTGNSFAVGRDLREDVQPLGNNSRRSLALPLQSASDRDTPEWIRSALRVCLLIFSRAPLRLRDT